MSAEPPADPQLRALAAELGCLTEFWDTRGVHRMASAPALVAVLRAAGVDVEGPDDLDGLRAALAARRARPVEPVGVVWDDGALSVELRLPESCTQVRCVLHAEHGGSEHWEVALADLAVLDGGGGDGAGPHWLARRIERPGPLPVGRHTLEVRHGDDVSRATVLVAPSRVVAPGPGERTWGLFAPVYSLRDGHAAGPHVGHLAALGEWLASLGGRVVATLPLLATYLDRPFDPSPYAPVSRRFWNELWLDLDRLGELAAAPEVEALLASPAVRHEIAELRAAPSFDYRRQAGLHRRVLELAARAFFASGGAATPGYRRFLAERPEVTDYARFRAEVTRRGTGWHAWEAPARDGVLPDTDHTEPDVGLHLYAQYAMHHQMHDLAERLAANEQRLYLDLPVGAHGDGYDTWRERALFAWGAAVGAPPDDFFTEGQNWGFPPMIPERSRDDGHRHLAECLRHHMGVAGILRLDHVMQFHRLYWVPDGMAATDGVYVRYPLEELLATVSIESHRTGCRVVGEDLGTVPDEVRDALGRHGLAGMYVAVFQLPTWEGGEPGIPDERMVASVDTHDTPTFAGFVRGLDIRRRRDTGLLDDAGAATELAERQRRIDGLAAYLARTGHLATPPPPGVPPGDEDLRELLAGLLRFLAGSEAATLLVSIEDLWLEEDPHNIPGTPVERPNWVRRLREPLDELVADGQLVRDLTMVQGCRLAAHARTKETW